MAVARQPETEAHVAYCGLCGQRVLYVDTWMPGGTRESGEVLDLEPSPGPARLRWYDRGDGFYVRRRHPPTPYTVPVAVEGPRERRRRVQLTPGGRKAHRCR